MTEHDPRTDAAEDAAADAGDTDMTAADADRSELPPLREYNVFAAFADQDAAREAVVALERSGIDGNSISAVQLDREAPAGSDTESERHAAEEEDVAMVTDVGIEAAKGTVLGSVLGAGAAAAATAVIPGVGAVIGGGILGAAIGGGVAGAGVGGFVGAVSSTPASRSWQRALVEVGDGDLVVGVHSDDRETFDRGVEALSDAGATSLRKVDHEGEPI